MCLVTKQKRVKILKTDLQVYKVLLRGNISIFSPFEWKQGRLYSTEMGIRRGHGGYLCKSDAISTHAYENLDNCTEIGQGYHACLTEERANHFIIRWMDDCAVHKFRIPKGARVFYDRTGLVVSNKIIML